MAKTGQAKRDSARRNKAQKVRQRYLEKIKKLCEEVSAGDDTAVALLQKELDKSSLARSVFKKHKQKKVELKNAAPKIELDPELVTLKEKFQRQGFDAGSHVASSRLRKITK